MSLPTLRLSFLRSSPFLPAVARGLAGKLRGRVILLPDVLGRPELDEVVDALTLLLGLPVYIFAEGAGMEEMVGQGPGGILVLPAPVQDPPEPVRSSIVVCVRQSGPEDASLGLPPELMLLRDAIIECLTRQLAQTRLAAVPGWVASVADTPATAMRFVDGVQMLHLLSPEAEDGPLFCAGLASVVGWMLQTVDPSVAQWVLAMAISPAAPEQLVGAEVGSMTKDAALQAAFEAGLVYQLPVQEGGGAELRRPLGAIAWLGTAPGAPPVEQFAAQLIRSVQPSVRPMLQRLSRPPVRGLGLAGPLPPAPFVGRAELLQRVISMVEPSDRLRTCVLHGAAGSGRSSTAAALAYMLGQRLEPLWVHFGEGAHNAWTRAAIALGVDTTRARSDKGDVPAWVQAVHERLLQGQYLIIADGIETVPEWELPAWLPRGPGRSGMIVISRTAQHALQRSHEATAVAIPPLTIEEARQLFSSKAPQIQAEIERGAADPFLERLGRSPGPIVLASSLLALAGPGYAAMMERIAMAADSGPGIAPRLMREVLDSLRGPERDLMLALAICSPGGSPYELLLRVGGVAEGEEHIVDRLSDRGLTVRDARLIRLHGLARGSAERALEEDAEVKRTLVLRHAEEAEDLVVLAAEQDDATTRSDLHGDLVLAVKRTTALCAGGFAGAFETCVDAAVELSSFPFGSRSENLELAIEAFRAALSVRAREEFPESWAAAQMNLGSALTQLTTGTRADRLRQAIEAFRAALLVFTAERDPVRWAATQVSIGTALSELPTGDRTENMRQAAEAFRLALTVYRYEQHPEGWATVQGQLGAVLLQIPLGDRTENLRLAIDALRNALTVKTRESSPEDWAQIQGNMGAALSQIPLGDRAENLRQAILAYRAALSVYSFEYFPEEWAKTQTRLGSALMDLPVGSAEERMRQAIEAFRSALAVYTKQEHPFEWALTQNRMGSALSELPADGRGENLALAIDAFRSALSVLTRKDTPTDWAAAQNNLGTALLALPAADRTECLRLATQAFRAALTVYTREAFPQRWALVQRNLAKAYASLPSTSANEGEAPSQNRDPT